MTMPRCDAVDGQAAVEATPRHARRVGGKTRERGPHVGTSLSQTANGTRSIALQVAPFVSWRNVPHCLSFAPTAARLAHARTNATTFRIRRSNQIAEMFTDMKWWQWVPVGIVEEYFIKLAFF